MTAHVVPEQDFDLLARGDGTTSGVLGAGQRSKRLALLVEVVATMRVRSPRVFAAANGDHSEAVLREAHRRSPAAVEEVLLNPHVGAWASHCLKVLLDGPGDDDGDPICADVGHLGAIAASAALRAGLAAEVTTYVGAGGRVVLPSLGRATVGAVGSCRATVRCPPGGAGVELTAGDVTRSVAVNLSASPGWEPIHRLRSSAGPVEVAFALDDLDPYRGCGDLPVAERPAPHAQRSWQACLDEAWPLLVQLDTERADAIAAGVHVLVPLRPTADRSELSATCHPAIGAVALTPPRDPLALVLALVHEFQHTKLSALLDLVPLVAREPGRRFYAPWRPDPRPIRGLLHGLYAFHGLAGFWERYRHHADGRNTLADRAHFEFALVCRQVAEVARALDRSDLLTAPGQRFLAGLGHRLAVLERQPMPESIRWLAGMALLDNKVGWRLRNIDPDPDVVGDWAAAWRAGRPCPDVDPARSTAVDGGGPLPSEDRLTAMRAGLVRSSGAGQGLPAREVETTWADRLLLDGCWGQAADAYEDQLSEVPAGAADDLPLWSGLGVAHSQALSPSAEVLVRCPENVRALYRALVDLTGSAPGVTELAAWLGKALVPAGE